MKLGYAHQSTGAHAIAQAVRDLVSDKAKEVVLVIACPPAHGAEARLLATHRYSIEKTSGTYRWQLRENRFEDGSHMLVGFSSAAAIDPVTLAAVLAEHLIQESIQARNFHGRADVFRPLDQVDPANPVVSSFEV